MSQSTDSGDPSVPTALSSQMVFEKHPRSLWWLTGVEIAERFSFYAVLSLLALFLTASPASAGFGWTSVAALQVIGTYSAIIYFTPIIGGVISDRFIGPYRATIIGGIAMAFGHLALSAPEWAAWVSSMLTQAPVYEAMSELEMSMGVWSVDADTKSQLTEWLSVNDPQIDPNSLFEGVHLARSICLTMFFSGLALIGIGNGLFKPSISTLVGNMYGSDNSRRQRGFTIFWTGINVGALLAAFIAGGIGEQVGWHYAFSLAGFVMAIAIIVFIVKRPSIELEVEEGVQSADVQSAPIPKKQISMGTSNGVSRIRLIAILLLSGLLFEVLFAQVFGLLPLFINEYVDRSLFGFLVPTTWLIGLNPFVILVLAPLFTIWMARRARAGHKDRPFIQLMAGFAAMAITFAILAISAQISTGAATIGIWMVVLAMTTISIAEIPFRPIGLALINQLSSAKGASTLMGAWFLTFSIGGWLAGQVGVAAQAYGEAFVFSACCIGALALSIALFFISKPLERQLATVNVS